MPGLLKATEAAEFSRERHRRYFGHAPKSLQRIDDGPQLLGCGINGSINRGVEPLDTLPLVVDLQDQLDERRILLSVR
ncbi:MAG: hypothetical protein ABI548_27805 [Polyangiaceae bacterium]